jgi:hypothetical protein
MRPTSARIIPLFAAIVVGACTKAPEAPILLHDKPGALKAGAGQKIFDWPVGHPTAGYAQSPYVAYARPSDDPGSPYADIFPATRAIETPPAAKVVVLDNRTSATDTDHWRVVMAKIDAIGVTDVLTERVIQLAKERLNEDIAGQLILNATHTHDAGCRFSRTSIVPDIINDTEPSQYFNALAHGFDTYSQESTDRVAGSVVDAIAQAIATMRPATFGYASAVNETAASDRRCENDPLYGPDYHDKNVTVMRVDDAATKKPIAVMFHFAQHGTLFDGDSRSQSVDAPGYAEYMVEELFDEPMVAMFVQGAAGDVSPQGRGSDASQAMQAAGWSVAQTVKEAYDAAAANATGTLVLQSVQRWSPIGYELLGYQKGEFYKDGAILCFQVFGNEKCEFVKPHDTKDITDDTLNICTAHGVPGGGKFHTQFAAARIGDLAFVTSPGEPTTHIGAQLIEGGKKLGFKDVLVVGYSQDHNGYILDDIDWLSGGYEPTISFWGWKFGKYTVDQGIDTLLEMQTGKPKEKREAQVPNMQPDEYTKVQPTASTSAPAFEVNAPATLKRMTTLQVTFTAGDPGFGTPRAVLQRKDGGTFVDVKKNGWIPVTNDHGYEIKSFYEATPTFRAEPKVTSRKHLWTVKYEPWQDLPVGEYRLHITGRWKDANSEKDYTLDTDAFQLVPSDELAVDGKLTVSGNKIVFDANLLYPQQKPVGAPKPSTGWQIDHFKLYNPRFGQGFSPAPPAAQLPMASVNRDQSGETQVALSFVERAVDAKVERYAPGEGSGLHAEITTTGSGTYVVSLPSVTDAYGNTAPAKTFQVTVP